MSKQRIRILLIEDDPADHHLINRSLGQSRLAVDVVWSDDLRTALSQIAASDFHVVLTDLSLPDSCGLETVHRIRNQDRDIPIIVLTTLNDEGVEATSLSVGAQDYLSKDDASPHNLERAIVHAIWRQEVVVENQRLLAEVQSSREQLAEQKVLLKRKNRRLRRLYKTAHRFVDNVSHEFRTPLTVIKDYVALVREGVVGEVNIEQCRMLDIVGVRTDDLNNMVDDMLDVSKLESGLLGAWRRPCQLADVVEPLTLPLLKKAEVKGIVFEVDVDAALPPVYCDAEMIGRVIINLVTNAMKFCGEPGTVKLWTRADAARHEVVVGVTDNGSGIDDEGLSIIFQRFKQLKRELKTSTKGFGLGLNIAKELVDLNFGEMTVESRLGRGSTFSFTVPLNDPQNVMERYVERVRRMKHEERVVALVRTRIDAGTSAADAEDADVFFNFLLRRSDLLFRAGVHEWLFVLWVARSEAADFEARARTEWLKTNRNRPYGPIPDFELTHDGQWNVESSIDAVLNRFRRVMHSDADVATAGASGH
ncbi:MAG: hybrid sensor histidine kinase/response regulator [Planctomycetaceae bacterium]|nr:hybrid sensor histidine kinase/response regulator [Planctomycetaceae bacterium]